MARHNAGRVVVGMICMVLGLSCLCTAAAPGSWRSGFRLFSAREKLTAVCHGNTATVFGGLTSSLDIMHDVWRYNAATGLWEELYPVAETRISVTAHSMVSVDGGLTFYVYGGLTGADKMTGDLWKLDSNMHWSLVKPVAGDPGVRIRHSAVDVAARSSFVVFTGLTTDRMLNDVWEYSVSANTWTRLHSGQNQPAPTPRFNTACAMISGTVTMCFGGTELNGDTNELWQFDHASNTWHNVQTTGAIPMARRLGIMYYFASTGRLALFGGYSSVLSTAVPSTSVHVLDLSTFPSKTWTEVTQANMPPTRDSAGYCMLGAGTNNERALMLGGLDFNNNRRNDVWSMTSVAYRFAKVSDDVVVPEGRYGHVAVMVGEEMFIGLGAGETGMHTDNWKYSPTTDRFAQTLPLPSTIPGRIGASAVVRGNTVWFFGGQLQAADPTALSNQLFYYNMQDSRWSVAFSSNAPPARAFHAAIDFREHIMVFSGRVGVNQYATDLWVYSPALQSWRSVASHAAGAAWPSGRRGHGMIFLPDKNAALIIGGMGQTGNLHDRWELTFVNDNAVFTERPSLLSAGTNTRSFIRAEAGFAGSGSRMFVAGGTISEDFPSPISNGFYEWNNRTGVNALLARPPVMTFLNTLVYYKRSLYNFGGRLATGGLKRIEVVNGMLIYDVMPSFMCQFGQSSDDNCLQCSSGTSNPLCTIAAKGSYQETPYAAARSCPSGSFGSTSAAAFATSCQPCPGGTFSNSTGSSTCYDCPPGQVCPVGASEPFTRSNFLPTSISTTQPHKFAIGAVPEAIYTIFVICVVSALVIVLFMVFMETMMSRWRIGYYINTHYRERLVEEYNNHVVGQGLDECTLFAVLTEVLGESTSNLDQERLDKIKAARDEDGSMVIDETELLLIVTDLVEGGYIPALPDTQAAKDDAQGARQDPAWVRFAGSVRINQLDFFSDKHRIGRSGDPICIQQNTFGGVLFVINVMLMVMIALLLFAHFFYDNTIQTRSSIPQVVVDETITSDAEIVVRTQGDTRQSSCITTEGICAPLNIVRVSDEAVGNSSVTTCSWEPPRTCAMKWSCVQCTVVKTSNRTATTKTSVEFNFGADGWFSTQTVVDASFSTGVLSGDRSVDQRSVNQVSFLPASNATVFKGNPHTLLQLELTPTLFNGPQSNLDTRTIRGNGYHSLPVVEAAGNEVTSTQFNHFSGVPVTVDLLVAPSTLVVQQESRQTPIMLATSILGTISGVGAVCVIVVHLLDGFSQSNREKKEAAREKERAAKRDERKRQLEAAIKEDSEGELLEQIELRTRRERPHISNLLNNGVKYNAAKTIVRTVDTITRRKVRQTVGAGPLVQKPSMNLSPAD